MCSVKLEMPHNLYSLPDVIRVIKLRSMKWESHVACVGYNETIWMMRAEMGG